MQALDHDHQSIDSVAYWICLGNGNEIKVGDNLTLKQAKAKVESTYPGSTVYEDEGNLIEDDEYSDTTSYLVTILDASGDEEIDFGMLYRVREYFDNYDDMPGPDLDVRAYWAARS